MCVCVCVSAYAIDILLNGVMPYNVQHIKSSQSVVRDLFRGHLSDIWTTIHNSSTIIVMM